MDIAYCGGEEKLSKIFWGYTQFLQTTLFLNSVLVALNFFHELSFECCLGVA